MKLFKLLAVVFVLGCYMGCDKEEDIAVNSGVFLSADTLNFDNLESQQFTITIEPSDTCSFDVVAVPSWIEQVSPMSGVIDGELQLTVTRGNIYGSGQFSGSIKIQTRLGTITLVVERFIQETVEEKYSLYLPDSVIINEFTDLGSFEFFNEGTTPFEWELAATNGLLTVGESSGSTAADGEETITLEVNRDGLDTGDHFSNLVLSAGDHKDTIPVRIKHFQEYKIKIEEEVADAAFSKTKNALIYASSNPLAVVYFDIATESASTIALNYAPTCLAIDKNGDYAVVGHDARMSYVDLVNGEVIMTVDIPAKVYDIELADNGWAYISPRDYEYNLIGVDLSNGNVVRRTKYSDTSHGKIKVDKTGKYIYMISYAVTPKDLHKYDIQNDTAKYLYDSRYHGDYSMYGDLWFSEDGARIFTGSGTVFKTAELEENDVVYNGEMDIHSESAYPSGIESFDTHAATNRIFVVPNSGSGLPLPYLLIHNYENLLETDKIELEKYIVKDGNGGGQYFEAEPFFTFCNADGDEVYVVTKAYKSGLMNEWAIQKIQL